MAWPYCGAAGRRPPTLPLPRVLTWWQRSPQCLWSLTTASDSSSLTPSLLVTTFHPWNKQTCHKIFNFIQICPGHNVVRLLEGGHSCAGRHSVSGGQRQSRLPPPWLHICWYLYPTLGTNKHVMKFSVSFIRIWPGPTVMRLLEGGHRRQCGGGRHCVGDGQRQPQLPPPLLQVIGGMWKCSFGHSLICHEVFNFIQICPGHIVVRLLEGGHRRGYRRQCGGGRHSVGGGQRQPQLSPPRLHVCWSSLLLIPV